MMETIKKEIEKNMKKFINLRKKTWLIILLILLSFEIAFEISLNPYTSVPNTISIDENNENDCNNKISPHTDTESTFEAWIITKIGKIEVTKNCAYEKIRLKLNFLLSINSFQRIIRSLSFRWKLTC